MKNKHKRRLTILIALALALTTIITIPAFSESGTEPFVSEGNEVSETGEATEPGETTEQGETPESDETSEIEEYGYYTGKNAKRIPVITYHNVLSNAEKKKPRNRFSTLSVSKSTFEKQMKYLHKKGYRTINCEELYLWHEGKIKLPKKSVLITFDDGLKGVADNALPVLKKYNMKGTSFIIGHSSLKKYRGSISYDRMKQIQEEYPDLEFQSHTFHLHKRFGRKGDYKKVLKDAAKQNKHYGFEYLAYPFGRYTKGMIKAYKKSGIKMAFTYGTNGYATKKQDLYKIRRIKISGTASFAQFKRWFK